MQHLRNHWKKYALAAGVAAAGSYGVPPEYSEPFLRGFCVALGAC